MYENIVKNFNYWPKKLAKIGYVYLGIVGVINLVIGIFSGFNLTTLVGLVAQIIIAVFDLPLTDYAKESIYFEGNEEAF